MNLTAWPMSQYGLDLMCMLPDEYGNQRLDAVVQLLLVHRADVADVHVRCRAGVLDDADHELPRLHAPICWTYSGVPAPRVSAETLTFFVRP